MRNKIIFIFGVMSLLFLIVIVASNSFIHYQHSINVQKEKAWILARLIAKSLEMPMLAGEMELVGEMLVTVGRLENLKRVHLVDTEGIIRYSAASQRVDTPTGSKIILEALEKKKQIGSFERRNHDHIYSLALPIPNEERCYACHGSQKEILGVLRVGIDWLPIRAGLQKILRKDVIVALVFYAVIMVLAFLFQRLYNNAQEAYKNLQRTQEQLVSSEKMAAIGQMAAAISHDLRNPLTGIKMAAYYLGSKIGREQTELKNIIKDIELEIDYASNVVTNILAFARPTELIYTRADINALIEETMPFFRLQNRGVNIEMATNYSPGLPGMLVDARQIKQVLINLMANAIQAMPKGGKLEISTAKVNDSVEIIVKDSGLGIPKNDITHIFTPFYTTRARGVGLGLAIVSNIIRKHGGTLKVFSELGLGTTFVIGLPIRESAP